MHLQQIWALIGSYGSVLTEAANSAARSLPLRPQKPTSSPNEELVATGH